MPLIISTGSNLGQRPVHLMKAKQELSQSFTLIEQSQIYESPAVDYTQQPDFLNQVLAFKIPNYTPQDTIKLILEIEKSLGRVRDIDKGPRSVDIDILFWNTQQINSPSLQVPHPRLFERSFIVLPLQELAAYSELAMVFKFPKSFDNKAWPYISN